MSAVLVGATHAPERPGAVRRDALLWAIARAATVLVLLVPAASAIPGDLKLFVAWSDELASGRYPADDLWQYPPGLALLLALVGTLGVGALGLVILNLAADFAILWQLRGTRGATVWATAPLFLGPIMLMRLDSLSTWSAVAGLAAGLATWRSGLLLGIGALLKIWPAALLAAFPWRGTWVRTLVLTTTVCLGALLAHLVLGPDPFWANQGARGLQVEAVAALPFLVAKAAGSGVDLDFRSGAVEIASPTADAVAAALPWMTAALLGLVAVRTLRCNRPVQDLAGLVLVLALLSTSRVLSPQFGVWMLGLLALVMATRSVPRSLVATILGTALMSQVVYPYLFHELLIESAWLAVAAQGVRVVLLVAAVSIAGREWWAATQKDPTIV